MYVPTVLVCMYSYKYRLTVLVGTYNTTAYTGTLFNTSQGSYSAPECGTGGNSINTIPESIYVLIVLGS